MSECSFITLFKHQNNFPSYIFAYKEKIPSTIMHWGYWIASISLSRYSSHCSKEKETYTLE